MIIIWRGFGGILTLLLACAALFVPLSSTGSPMREGLMRLLFGLLAAAGCWFGGQYLNKTRPRRVVEAHMTERAAAVRAAVENGTFAPGGIRPSSLQEARAQGEALLTSEWQELNRIPSRHTLFFVPMQWWSVPCAISAALGLFLVVHQLFVR